MIIAAPPSGGKSTQASKISKVLGIPHLSTGLLLLNEVESGSDDGQKAKAGIAKDGAVSGEVALRVLARRFQEQDCARGFVLEGFPRTLEQAEALDALLARTGEKVTQLISLEAPDSWVVQRITGRWVHEPSGRTYDLLANPPKSLQDREPSPETMLDDVTQEPLTQRPTDTQAAAFARLKVYHAEIAPVVAHYRDLPETRVTTVDGSRQPDEVALDIRMALPTGLLEAQVRQERSGGTEDEEAG